MRLSTIAFALIWTAMPGAAALAQERQFPYAAIVQSDNVQVRSGRGEQFYATGVLSRGARVTVHRHDPGGWCVISPPEGSFSWIAAEHVRRLNGNRGAVAANNVIVRIGSTLSESHHGVYQTELSTDDPVEILGEKTLSIDGRLKHMYKIAPPPGEYRYVPGQFLAPADRPQPQDDPFAEPLVARQGTPAPRTPATQPRDAVRDEIVERPVVRTQSKPEGTTAGEIPAASQQKLRALDDRFRAMIQREPKDWNLTELERGYRDLAAAASHPALNAQLERRFPAIEKYKGIKAQYEDLMQLTSETSRRDAQLLSIQRQTPDTADQPETATPAPLAPRPQPSAQPQPPDSASAPTQPRSDPPFDGAGIIQRVANPARGAPQHVLVAPDGRLLAYLQAARGINLDHYVGREMGLYGERYRHRSMQADYLVVRGLTPVRLAK